MIFFNGYGIIFTVGGFILGLLASVICESITKQKLNPVLFAAGFAGAADLIYRCKSNLSEEVTARLLYPSKGGQIMFLPIWAIGIFFIFILFLDGIQELRVWSTNRNPVQLTISEFMKQNLNAKAGGLSLKYVHLTECNFDIQNALQRQREGKIVQCYVPILPRNKEEKYNFRVFLKTDIQNVKGLENYSSIVGMVPFGATEDYGEMELFKKQFGTNWTLLEEHLHPSRQRGLLLIVIPIIILGVFLGIPFYYRKKNDEPLQDGRRRRAERLHKKKISENVENVEEEVKEGEPPANVPIKDLLAAPKIKEESSNLQAASKIKEKSSNLQTAPKIKEKPSNLQAAPKIKEKSSNLQVAPKIKEKPSNLQAAPKIKEESNEESSNSDELLDFFCPHCQTKTSLRKSLQPMGKNKKCKKCGNIFNLSSETMARPTSES